MIELAVIALQLPVIQQEQVSRFCSYVVGIPYASDNFTDAEWERFKVCRDKLIPIWK